MKKNKKKIITAFLCLTIITIMSGSAYGHSGRTDSRGGHKDNQNKSGLGSYHYHCGGNPPHLHTNGVCPYSSSSSSSSGTTSSGSTSSGSSKSKSSKSSDKSTNSTSTITSTPKEEKTTIEVENVKINETITTMKVGEKRKLTATITPDNATDKTVSWKSNDELVVSITQDGEIEALKAGTAELSLVSSNNKIDTISITVEEEIKVIDNAENAQNTVTTLAATNSNNMTSIKDDNSNPVAGIISLGLIGGAGYWGYKKFKGR